MGKRNNLLKPSVYGVGYIGIGKYSPQTYYKIYSRWKGMMERGYNKKYHERFPTYADCLVDEQWHNFQNFAKWYEENWKDYMDSSWDLDKDILFKGNKVYSPETCCFVPSEINYLFVRCNKQIGKYPIGINKTSSGKYIARCQVEGVRWQSKPFEDCESASILYKEVKKNEIIRLANKWKLYLAEPTYQALINYKV